MAKTPNGGEMDAVRTVRVGEEVWARLKRRALDERVTLREVVERAAEQYLHAAALRDAALPARTIERNPPGEANLSQARVAARPAKTPLEPEVAAAERRQPDCRTCGHGAQAHSRGEQRACGKAGCSCARYRP